jgi:hypothetical protein
MDVSNPIVLFLLGSFIEDNVSTNTSKEDINKEK